jgi:protein subunit release factor B
MLPVSLEKEKALRDKLDSLEIYEKDIQEKFICSGGKGGQNVNKVATCVYLKHVPTGIEVKCQRERTQGLNRYRARELLYKKIERFVMNEKSEEVKRIEKLRRQKRKRSKRAKDKMLDDKHKQAQKKKKRGSVPDWESE